MTDQPDIDQRIAAIASLDEPVRRALYRYVAAQERPVGRSQAAEALGITRALASFHLDKLMEEGLLEAEFRRMTGRSGPGAGRPSKLYRRSRREVEVSLPPRSYELAARLFARALDRGKTQSPRAALQAEARTFGETLAREAHRLAGPDADPASLQECAEIVLATYGFEPFHDDAGVIRLRNCPFDALANEHRPLVCGMNLAIMDGLVDELGVGGIEAVLDPQPGICCVAFRPTG
jgi:predicted ArsR family transcriptional regulator